jgi:Na+-transporting methylmalonyl-CoA/oxaloacetate decarboxylase gamma subunit
MSNLALALQITAVGMGLVFAAIILLWWMMALMTSLLAEKDKPAKTVASDSAKAVTVSESDIKARAAAIAVAVALADHQVTHIHPLSDPPTAIVSAWQLGMRTRQLSQKGTPLVRNPRKVGSK